MNLREKFEQREQETLSKYATISKNSLGRSKNEQLCPVRTIFQQDRDRIIHCKSFRKLKHKTQVFLSPKDDYFRTRLTHTLEVAQVARTIARALRLNEDLTEAISLAHDIGHTPFGHAGEAVLNKLFHGGFRHFEQSLRVIDILEKNGKGLNLSYEVRNGVVCHTKGKEADTLEGRIVKIADKIAYINHDIDDATRAGILYEEDIPKDTRKVLGNRLSQRINTMVMSLIENSCDGVLSMSADVQKHFDILHSFMYEKVYRSDAVKAEEDKVPYIINGLYSAFLSNIELMPKVFHEVIYKYGKERAVCDYIASMTDGYAIKIFETIYIPKSWENT